jgi:hypothetical protein
MEKTVAVVALTLLFAFAVLFAMGAAAFVRLGF